MGNEIIEERDDRHPAQIVLDIACDALYCVGRFGDDLAGVIADAGLSREELDQCADNHEVEELIIKREPGLKSYLESIK